MGYIFMAFGKWWTKEYESDVLFGILLLIV